MKPVCLAAHAHSCHSRRLRSTWDTSPGRLSRAYAVHPDNSDSVPAPGRFIWEVVEQGNVLQEAGEQHRANVARGVGDRDWFATKMLLN